MKDYSKKYPKICLNCNKNFMGKQKSKYCSLICFAKFRKGIRLSEEHRQKLGKPNVCEYCQKNNLVGHSIHWANKSRTYQRKLNDWIRLCAKCHKAYDRNQIALQLLFQI